MKQQKTVESRVLEILKECPMSRYDDMLLILHYYNRYGYIPAGNLPLEDIVFNYRAYGLPCFETIRRARQRVQSLFPEYSRNPQKEEQSGSISIIKVGSSLVPFANKFPKNTKLYKLMTTKPGEA